MIDHCVAHQRKNPPVTKKKEDSGDFYLLWLCQVLGGQNVLAEYLGVGPKRLCKWINRINWMRLECLQKSFDLSLKYLRLSDLREQQKLVKHFIVSLVKPRENALLEAFVCHLQRTVPHIPLFFDLDKKSLDQLIIPTQSLASLLKEVLVLEYDSHLPLLIDETKQLLSPVPLWQQQYAAEKTSVDVYVIEQEALLEGKKPFVELQYYSIISRVVAADYFLQPLLQKSSFLNQEKIRTVTQQFGFADPALYWYSRDILLKGSALLIEAVNDKRIAISQAKEIALIPSRDQESALASYFYQKVPTSGLKPLCIKKLIQHSR